MFHNELNSDADIFLGNQSANNIGHPIDIGTYTAVINELKSEEIKSFLFLLMPIIGLDRYLSVANKTNDNLKSLLTEVVEKNLYNKNLKNVFCELLITTKQYKLLKKFNLCKHNPEISNIFFGIQPYWKMLYEVCYNLNDNELKELKDIFRVNDELTDAEDILCHLHKSQKISENSKLDQFLEAMLKIQQKFGNNLIVKSVENYIDFRNRREIYFIRDPTLSHPCGLAIIVNQEKFSRINSDLPALQERTGSQIDKEKLKILWKKFGFSVEIYENLSSEELQTLFENLHNRPKENLDYDIFVACLLSHGVEGKIYGADSCEVEIKSLIYSVEKCTYLDEKPKLFFIQACQGEQHQASIMNNDIVNDSGYDNYALQRNNSKTMKGSDIYEAISTIPGFVSYRSSTFGSLFVSKLVEYLQDLGDKEDLDQIMTKVRSSTTEGSSPQMSITSTTLRKKVIFKTVSAVL